MNKIFIGIAIACFIAVLAGTADAAVPTRTKVKVKDFITKTATSWGNAIWSNKASIAVGTAAVAVATNPAPFVEGATTIITGQPAKIVTPSYNQATASQSATGSLWYYGFYLAATTFCIVGVRCIWNYVKDYKNWLPLMVVGILLCCGGIVEAAVITPPPVLPPVFISPIPWWNIVNFVLLVVSIFI